MSAYPDDDACPDPQDGAIAQGRDGHCAPIGLTACKRVPLFGLGGIRAWTLVDAEDYDSLAAHRWRLSHYGYAIRGTSSRTIWMHRAILGLEPGDPRRGDHISGDRLDNRRANLRIVTMAENTQNLRPRRGTSSKYRGVSWRKDTGKWVAYGDLHGKRTRLGCFESELDAARAASEWRKAHMPFTVESRCLADAEAA